METNNDNKTNQVSILHIINVFLRYWALLAISAILFLAIGVLYLKFASKTYRVYARISIRTEQARNTQSSAYVNVNQLMNQQKTFSNELTLISATPLIKEVITDMNLFTSYYIQEDKIPKELPFSLINIYNDSPFIVIVNERSPQPINTLFYFNIHDEETYSIQANEDHAYLYDFEDQSISSGEIHFEIGGIHRFGEMVENDYCSFKILLNSNYEPELYKGKDLFFRFNSPTMFAHAFQDALNISATPYASSIADLSFEGENLELSLNFLTQLINKYIERNLEKKNFDANNTIAYIDRQLATISGDLGQSERQLQNFRSRMDVMNMDEKTQGILNQIHDLEQDRDNIQSLHQNLLRLHDYFEANEDATTFIAPSSVGMSDATLATLIEELTNLSRERQNLISTNQLKNPKLITLDANIATIKNVIAENISFDLLTTQNELAEINARIDVANEEFSNLPQTQRQLQGLEREFNIRDAVYTSLLDRRMQAQIIKASNQPDCEIIEPVQYVAVASPSVKKTAVIALFLGLFFPSIYIVFVNFLTQRIRTKEELSRFSKLTNIGHISHNPNTLPNVITGDPQSPIAERFHSIRSTLIYHMFGETHKCILVTSTLPAEGKSFIALNLAYSFASTNSKTLLIGFDLRKNSDILIDLKANVLVGLSSYLINKASLEDITINTDNPNLDFLHNGEIPPNPVTLLSSPRTSQLFEELKYIYDYIIVDTPPFGLVTDAFLLMQYADINLYVSRMGIITKKALKQGMDDIQTKNIEKIYHIYNDISKIDKSYSDKYGYPYQKRKQNRIKRFFLKR